MKEPRRSPFSATVAFLILCLVFVWTAHCLALYAHEYTHSGGAWILGWKSNPLALEYGRFSRANLHFFGEVDENVDYPTIFAQGHPRAAALIAFAGIFANGLLYLLCRLLLRKESIRSRPLLFRFFFWLCFMCVGNFYDYIPVRTFATHGSRAPTHFW
jgi:hypothetical protein